MKKKKKISAYKIISMAVLVILAILFTFPLYWILTGAFKTAKSINSPIPELIPKEIVFDNFKKLFSKQVAPIFEIGVPFIKDANGESITLLAGPELPAAARWLINTVFMAVMAMILTCITAAMAGYALAKKRFRGRMLLFTLIVCAMALPK